MRCIWRLGYGDAYVCLFELNEMIRNEKDQEIEHTK